jgi:cytoskeletal protein CcmA (bactofilin family)
VALTRKVKSGLTQAPFDTYIGEPGQIFFSNDTGEIRISDGVTPKGKPVYVAVTNANIGNLVITGSTIEALNTDEDLNLNTNGSGNVNIYGSFKVHTDGLNSTVSFDAAASGLLTINAPNPVPSGSSGALNIVGSADGSFMPVTGAGGMIHITGNPDTLARVTIDGFLTSGSGAQTFGGATAGYGTIAMRAARGTPSNPLPVLKDDLIGNYSALGWVGSSSRYSPNQVAGLQFFAAETFTNASATGTYAQMRLAPAGTNAGVVSTTFFGNGIVTGNITISNTATFNGPSVFNGLITSNGGRISNGDTVFNGNLLVNGLTTFNGAVSHTGDTTFEGNLTINNGLTVDGDTTHQGNLTINGQLDVAGNAVVTKQLFITSSGNIQFNDGSIQTTAAIQSIDNIDHITGAFAYAGTQRKLQLSSDATPTNTPSTIVSRNAQGNVAVGNVTATTLTTTSITANSSIAGSLTVYGNLNVVGTTTTTTAEAIHVDSKTLTVANSATLISQVDGAGLLVGNTTIFADFVFDSIQDAWRSNVGFVPAQNEGANLGSETRNWGNLYVTEAYVSNKLNVGVTPIVDYLNVAQFTANVPQYSQVYNQNLSSNSGASTDFVAANDIGGEINNYIDMGINSSTYNESAYSIQYANDGYVFINGGNLTVGTQTLNKDIVFHTDGTTADKEAGRVHLGRWIMTGAVDDGVTRFQIGDNLRVVGNVTAGNVSATNLTNQFATLTANAAAQANQITGANAAIVTANTAMKAYVDAVTTAWTANAATQQVSINSLATNANANTSAYLSNGISSNIVTTGNITAGNVTATNFFGTATQVSNSLTAGYGLKLSSGTTYNGSTALTINKYDAITSATATGSGANGWTYSLDLGTATGTVIVDAGGNFSGTVTITGTPIVGKVVRLIVIGGIKGATTVTVSGLTAGNSSNGLNTFAATSGTASSVIVEFICSTTALSGVYMNTSGAK